MQGLGRAMLRNASCVHTRIGEIVACCLYQSMCTANSGSASDAKLWGGHVVIDASCIPIPGCATISIPRCKQRKAQGGPCFALRFLGLFQ